jgi:hypothetical protein
MSCDPFIGVRNYPAPLASKDSETTQLGVIAPLRLRGSSRFRLYWELSDGGGADALYDFAIGEVVSVNVSSVEAACAPDITGTKVLGPEDPRRRDVWKWTREGGGRLIGPWAELNARHLTADLFDQVVEAIASRIRVLVRAGVVEEDADVGER